MTVEEIAEKLYQALKIQSRVYFGERNGSEVIGCPECFAEERDYVIEHVPGCFWGEAIAEYEEYIDEQGDEQDGVYDWLN